jgi:hypothetical protein
VQIPSLPELSSLPIILDEAGMVAGWFNPTTAPAIMGRFIHLMKEVSKGTEARCDEKPFPRSAPLPPGWELDIGMSLECGHSLLYAPPRDLFGHGEDEEDDEPATWNVVSVDGQLGLRWYFTITMDGQVTAHPYLLSDYLLPIFTIGEVPQQLPPGGPASIPLGSLGGRLRRLPEEECRARGIKFEISDGYSYTEEYHGPFWDFEPAT